MTDETLHPDATELELDRLRAKVRALEECLRLANEGALQVAGRIAELVREEREACAALADKEAQWWLDRSSGPYSDEAANAGIAERIAELIRARGSK